MAPPTLASAYSMQTSYRSSGPAPSVLRDWRGESKLSGGSVPWLEMPAEPFPAVRPAGTLLCTKGGMAGMLKAVSKYWPSMPTSAPGLGKAEARGQCRVVCDTK